MNAHAEIAPAGGPARAAARPLRVLCVTPAGPEGQGGIDRLYRYLREAGRLTPAEGIDLRFVAGRGTGAGPAGWVPGFPARAAGFAALAARWRPDVVHVNFATGGSLLRKWVLARIARAFGARVVIHFHGQFPLADGRARDLQGRVFLALCRLASRVVALGPVSRERFAVRAGVAPERICVVPNGIPDFAPGLMLPKASGGPVRILLAGLVGEHKGVPVLIEALARLAANPAWTCTVAGNGEVDRCAGLAAAAGLADRIRFTGWIDPEAMHRLMREADLVVLPSLSENMPLSLIEGACAGAALVATDVGETRSILNDGVNGVLVRRDPEALAAAIGGLIGDRGRLGAMQAASRRIYEADLGLDAMADRLKAVYAAAAGDQ
ncbi:glycosyltransferase family 4 protein [Methylobacterium oryzihabitans]|uniref:Glycosyltransferase family 1 protein n=1 Tax=Methylobacterium oryzihabitans TaxID=2499852 RepID=A0A3S2VBK4_9HYPH|nr:glycosyltransferase family 4 protein [Methylobacterium oryzihabitans]RVU20579.1 glycosyltransferase family 1 protein [Methylobacterium oryzihabitans]